MSGTEVAGKYGNAESGVSISISHHDGIVFGLVYKKTGLEEAR